MQRYRQTEMEYNEICKKWEELDGFSKLSLIESQKQVRAKTDERNQLICTIIQYSKKLNQTIEEVKLALKFFFIDK